eukprot:m.242468 g.242468  ORF g.242468 m.242468 type:complete len:154 (-) comp25719_c0_seq1:35-496(-)
MKQFRVNVWDPALLIAQMVALQSVFYLILGAVSFLLAQTVQAEISLDLLFSTKAFQTWQIIPGYFVSALLTSLFLWQIVGKVKQCLDFALTVFFFHFMACVLYDGFPTRLSWWITHLICTSTMVVVSEYLCIHGDLVTSIDISVVGVSPKNMK